MAERRAIDAALKWLGENEEEHPLEPSVSPSKRPKQTARPSATRHDRKCCVCRHRERPDIESEFLRWRSAESIAKEYGIAHHSSIYRHARATGLFVQRATHLRLALSPIIEEAPVVRVTADSILRAVALCARLNDQGEWINPPKYVNHSAKPDCSRPFPKARRDPSPAPPAEASGGFDARPACPERSRRVPSARQVFAVSPATCSQTEPAPPRMNATKSNSENASNVT